MIGRPNTRFFMIHVILIYVVCALAACSTTQGNNPGPEDGNKAAVSSDTENPLNSSVGSRKEDHEINAVDREKRTGSNTTAEAAETCETDMTPQAEGRKRAQESLDEALEFCRTSQDFWSQGDFDNAISSLDQAYALILQAKTSEQSKLIQQKEDIRFMICKRMLEIYASQSTVVNGNHNAIPLVMNRHVEKEIKQFRGPERKFFIESYKRSGRYRKEIVVAMKEAGLPEELSWLPLIESGFKVRALSSARALGPWQFIPSTGYKFGLQRDQWVDERMDVTKSTLGAIAYMQELHKLFGDWSTVLAAYNCGEFRVLRVIRSQNVNYLDNFWDLFERLPWETARYVPRFMAALHIINDPEKYGMDLGEPDPPLEYETVQIAKQMRLKDIAKTLAVPSEELKLLNSELRYKVTLPTPYELKVPVGKGPMLTAKLDEIPAYKPPRRFYEYHRVRPGDTLSGLARRYRTSVRAIMQSNNLRKQHYIKVGQRLKIPVRGRSRVMALASQAAQTDGSRSLHHRVKRGDSLWLLASAYNTTVQEIKRLNGLKSSRLYIGQGLIIRKGIVKEASNEGTKSYCVKRGDSPFQIATAHNMKLGRFLRLNELTPRSRIYPGQALLVDAGR